MKSRLRELGLKSDDLTIQVTSYEPPGCREYIQTVKLKFDCSRCSNNWTTSKGRTIFYYAIKEIGGMINLKVKVETFKQDCLLCKGRGQISHYGSENARIGKKFGERMLQALGYVEKPVYDKELGSKMNAEHESAHCHACKAGKCSEGEGPRYSKSSLFLHLCVSSLSVISISQNLETPEVQAIQTLLRTLFFSSS